MDADLDLAAAVDRSLVASYATLVDHIDDGAVREFGRVVAFTTRLPLALFNGCIVTQAASAPDLEDGLAWVAGFGVPHRAWIRESHLAPLDRVALELGLEREIPSFPGMVLHPPAGPPPRPAPGVTVRPVEDAEGLEEHVGVIAGQGMGRDLAARLLPASFAFDPDVRLFTAYIDGRPSGTSLALRSGDVSGVYSVGTHPDARRRGVGTAATWAAVTAGRDWGCRTVVLQSSQQGLSIYRAMGFRTVVEYVTFRTPRK